MVFFNLDRKTDGEPFIVSISSIVMIQPYFDLQANSYSKIYLIDGTTIDVVQTWDEILELLKRHGSNFLS